MSDERESQPEPKPMPLPTNLGYCFGEVLDGILLLISELEHPMPNAAGAVKTAGMKKGRDMKELRELGQKARDIHSDMLPTLNYLLTKGNLPNDRLEKEIMKVKKSLVGIHEYTKQEKLSDSRSTIDTINAIIDKRLRKEKQLQDRAAKS